MHFLVHYEGRTYYLTWLGLGLNVVLKTMLATKGTTHSYINDILIDVTKILMMEVLNQLKEFGLTAKLLESLEKRAVLGLKLK